MFDRTNIDPSEFLYLGSYDLGIPFNVTPCAALLLEFPIEGCYMDRCSICGMPFRYGDVWEHTPTGLHLVAEQGGHDLIADRCEYDAARNTEIERRKRMEARRGIRRQYRKILTANPGLGAALKTNHYIVMDIRDKFLTWGHISPKQIRKVIGIAERQVQSDLEPVVEGRYEMEGLVLAAEYKPGYTANSEILKMLVLCSCPGRFKVWGTAPKGWSDIKGRRVRFTARVKSSPDDESFGYFSRPTKAELI